MTAVACPSAGGLKAIEWTMGCNSFVAARYEPNKS